MKAKRVGLTMDDGGMVTDVATGGDTRAEGGSMGADSSGGGSNGATCNGSTESRSTGRRMGEIVAVITLPKP